FAGRVSLPGNMAMHPLHRIRSRKWKPPGEHLVERHAERIEVAARVERAIHPPGLLRRHIGERARDELWRFDRLSFARLSRRYTKAGKPHLPARRVHQNIGGLDVLVDETALVRLAESCGNADSDAQETPDVHRRADQPAQWRATGI